jgi:hypothetical protein
MNNPQLLAAPMQKLQGGDSVEGLRLEEACNQEKIFNVQTVDQIDQNLEDVAWLSLGASWSYLHNWNPLCGKSL